MSCTALYFAYGSDMNFEQLLHRCPSAEFVSPAWLPDHRLVFGHWSPKRHCGVLDLIPAEGESVPGGLFRMSESDLRGLDQFKDVSDKRCRRVNVMVKRADVDELIEAVATYTSGQKSTSQVSTNLQYLNLVIQGAEQCRLPSEHILWLRSFPLIASSQAVIHS